MIANSLYSKTVDYLQMSLGASVRRQEVIANNIANVDTPFYKEKMVTFESELNRVTELEKEIQRNHTPFLRKDRRHIPLLPNKSYHEVSPRLFEEFDTNYRNDKNNVDIEKQSSLMVKNTLRYNALTASLNSHLMRFKSVLT